MFTWEKAHTGRWSSKKEPSVCIEHAATAAKSLQSCPTLCDPIDGSPPGSPVLGILQARTLEWVAISFSNAWKWKVKVTLLSRVLLFATPWTAAYQAPLSMGFSRQEYWSRVPLPSPKFLLAIYFYMLVSMLSCLLWLWLRTNILSLLSISLWPKQIVTKARINSSSKWAHLLSLVEEIE